uniref:Uncharacterized protein n=1 Tax=uncultured Desulfobacterium sp. TaxID=201089 RepID=E1YGK3_9BACT|nr:unknown protein [uncultured Desulfobacterium sp.]
MLVPPDISKTFSLNPATRNYMWPDLSLHFLIPAFFAKPLNKFPILFYINRY